MEMMNKYPKRFVGCHCKALEFNGKIEKRQESLGELEAEGLGDSCKSLGSARGLSY